MMRVSGEAMLAARTRVLALLAMVMLGLPGAHAQTPAGAPVAAASPTTLSPDEAQRALAILTDPTRRDEIIKVLQAIATAAPAVEAAPEPAPPAAATIVRDGLLSQLLSDVADAADVVIGRAAMLVRPLAGLPSAWYWLSRTLVSPDTQALVFDAAWKVAGVIGLGLIVEWLARRAMRRPRRALVAAATPRSSPDDDDPEARLPVGRRCLLAAGGFVLDMAPILAFAIVAVAAAGVGTLIVAAASEQQPAARLSIMILINAHVVWAVLTSAAYRLTSPDIHRLRPLPLDDGDADYAYKTARRLLTFVVYALAALEIGRVLGMGHFAYAALLKLVILVAHAMLILVVLRCRRPVAAWIRGDTAQGGALGMLRSWIAAVWHLAAIFFLLALWLIWAADVRDGYVLMLRYFFSTALVLVLAQLLATAVLRGLDRLFSLEARDQGRYSMFQERAHRYFPALRRLVSLAGFVLTMLVLLQVWGLRVLDWFDADGVGTRLLSSAVVVAIAGVLALAVWEGVNIAIERHLQTLTTHGDHARAARMRTLLPLLRTSLLVFIVGIVGLTALSEIGVNIAPLLAGAGIVGVAIGFGSQKLVQDVINGVFLLLENAIHVGDWVTVADLSGSVENLSIRTIRIRAGDGAVHVVPFSSVTTVTNVNRGFAMAAISPTLAFHEDTDRVSQVLKDIATEMRKDAEFGPLILDDLALWGVDSVSGEGVTIQARLRCVDTGRWPVQREFNRRMKKRFSELGIEFADLNRRLVYQVASEGPAAPSNSPLDTGRSLPTA